MQFQFINKINRQLAAWFLVWVIIQTPVMVWLTSQWPTGRFLFKTMSEVYLLVMVGLSLVISYHRPQIYRLTIVKLLIGYGSLICLLALIGGGDIVALIGGLLLNLRFIVWCYVAIVVAATNPELVVVIKKRWWLAAWLVILIGVLQITILPKELWSHLGYSSTTIQPYLTVDQNPNLIRINSILRGPNVLGAMASVLFGLVLIKLIDQPNWRKIGMLLGIGLVLVATWSRSAWLATIISSWLICRLRLPTIIWQYVRRSMLTLSLVGLIITGFIVMQVPNGQLAYYFNHVVLHHNPDSQSIGKSNAEHSSSVTKAIQQIQQHPFGQGIGTTGSPSIYNQTIQIVENYFLMIGVEAGLLGLVCFSTLLGYIMIKLYQWRDETWALGLWATGCGLVVISLVLPIWTDGAVSYSWWGMVGLLFIKKEMYVAD